MFTQGFVSEHTILAAVTVGCPSNSRRASSISDLPAPAAQSSAGGTTCSLLPWLAVLPPGHPSNHPHILFFSAADQSALVLPSAWASAAVASLAPGGSLPGPRHRSPCLCSRRCKVNMVNKQQPSEEANSRGPHRKMPPYYTQNNDSST